MNIFDKWTNNYIIKNDKIIDFKKLNQKKFKGENGGHSTLFKCKIQTII